jgi:predicted ArsR family transcriptional regulator
MGVVNSAALTSQEHRTRERILSLVSAQGPITAGQIAQSLGLTATGVRRHLDALADAGAIAEHSRPATGRGPGRPARAYVVSDAGHAALPSGYADLAAEVLGFLDAPGSAALDAFAAARAIRVRDRYRHDVEAAGADPAARARALVTALSEDGYAASARPVGAGTLAGVQICQGHCPVHDVAELFPQLCEAEAQAFSDLLGVHVQRLATLAAGSHVCTTFVPTPAHAGFDQRRDGDVAGPTDRPRP